MIAYAEIRSRDGRWARVVREDGTAFIAEVSDLPPGTEIRPYASDSDPSPKAISARQLRLWLVRHGYTLAQVEALIAALPGAERDEARIEWEYATEYHRDNPVLRRLAGALMRAEGKELEARLAEAFTEASAY